jgi:hypothetical protein
MKNPDFSGEIASPYPFLTLSRRIVSKTQAKYAETGHSTVLFPVANPSSVQIFHFFPAYRP